MAERGLWDNDEIGQLPILNAWTQLPQTDVATLKLNIRVGPFHQNDTIQVGEMTFSLNLDHFDGRKKIF